VQRPPRQELGDRPALGAAQRQALIAHRSRRQRVDDRLRRSQAQRIERRRSPVGAVMTAGTVVAIDAGSIAASAASWGLPGSAEAAPRDKGRAENEGQKRRSSGGFLDSMNP
jgi:hypothetical protein